jgi:hypothetical protein
LEERLHVQGLFAGRWQGFRTVAGMVAVITAVLAGSTVGLLAAVLSDHSLGWALLGGAVVALGALSALMRYEQLQWQRAGAQPFIAEEAGEADA